MGRIMSHYYPKWIAVLAILVSVINSAASPVFGFLFAKILFVMMMPYSPTFEDDRNFWCGMFLMLALFIGVLGFL
jgi:hypothetical protein